MQYRTERNLKKFEYLGEKETKNETILIRWSVAQAVLNDQKSRWTVPLSYLVSDKYKCWLPLFMYV